MKTGKTGCGCSGGKLENGGMAGRKKLMKGGKMGAKHKAMMNSGAKSIMKKHMAGEHSGKGKKIEVEVEIEEKMKGGSMKRKPRHKRKKRAKPEQKMQMGAKIPGFTVSQNGDGDVRPGYDRYAEKLGLDTYGKGPKATKSGGKMRDEKGVIMQSGGKVSHRSNVSSSNTRGMQPDASRRVTSAKAGDRSGSMGKNVTKRLKPKYQAGGEMMAKDEGKERLAYEGKTGGKAMMLGKRGGKVKKAKFGIASIVKSFGNKKGDDEEIKGFGNIARHVMQTTVNPLAIGRAWQNGKDMKARKKQEAGSGAVGTIKDAPTSDSVQNTVDASNASAGTLNAGGGVNNNTGSIPAYGQEAMQDGGKINKVGGPTGAAAGFNASYGAEAGAGAVSGGGSFFGGGAKGRMQAGGNIKRVAKLMDKKKNARMERDNIRKAGRKTKKRYNGSNGVMLDNSNSTSNSRGMYEAGGLVGLAGVNTNYVQELGRGDDGVVGFRAVGSYREGGMIGRVVSELRRAYPGEDGFVINGVKY